MNAPERYEAKVDRSGGPDACHPWMACTTKYGYGHFGADGKSVLAHRFGYELHVGPIPDGLQIRHTCDNPPCQNPRHWLVGTNLDNVRDRMERGRQAPEFGEHNPSVKVTSAEVAEIRARWRAGGSITQQQLADEYGLSQGQVCKIVNGQRWAAA